jgi:type I restriction enzyme S subunit
MNNFPRYESYKDSGVDWLDKIPAHWEIQRGKWLFVKQDRPVRKEDEIITCFRDGQVTLRANRKTEGFTNALKEHGYQGIRKGDLVIHNMDAFAGAIGVSDSDGKSTPVYSACTPRKQNAVNSYFFAYFLRNLAKSGYIESLAKGIRERSTDFRFNDFGELLLSVPPLSEQTAIVEFLDRKTAQIEQAIAQKERLIELLKERRQILIHKAVTRGLNPNVKLKHSGVDWVGEIPEHWGVEKGKWLFQQKKRPVRIQDEIITCFRDGVVTLRANRRTEGFTNALQENGYQGIRKGDLVIHNMDAFAGAIGVSDSDGKSTPVYSVCVPKDSNKVNPYFFALLLRKLAKDGFIESLAKGIRERSTDFRFSDFASLLFSVPSLSEQNEIVSYCNEIFQKIETAISCKQKEIEKLKEYKAVLINSAVTGKIKVCGNSQNAEVKSSYAKSNE